jgi:DNA-binding beta-propeller fold protein YncE
MQKLILAILGVAATVVASLVLAASGPSATRIHPVSTIAIPGQPLQHLDFSAISEAHRLYGLADRSNHAVDLVDVDSDRFAGRVAGFASGGPNGLIAVGNDQFWAGGGNSRLHVIDLRSRKIIATIDTGGSKRVDLLGYDPRDHLVLAVNNDDTPPFVSFVSTAGDHRIVGKLRLPQATDGLEQPVWNPADGLVYLSIPVLDRRQADGGIAVIDPKARRVVDMIHVRRCMPAGLAIGPDNHMLVGCGDDAIAAGFAPRSLVVDLQTRKVVKEFEQVGGSDEVWYDERSGKYLLAAVANRGDPVLGIIDAHSNAWLYNVSTGSGAHSLAADSRTGKVFVPIAANQTPSGCQNGCIEVFGIK